MTQQLIKDVGDLGSPAEEVGELAEAREVFEKVPASEGLFPPLLFHRQEEEMEDQDGENKGGKLKVDGKNKRRDFGESVVRVQGDPEVQRPGLSSSPR